MNHICISAKWPRPKAEAKGRPELDLALAGGVSKLEGELEGESAEASGRPYPT